MAISSLDSHALIPWSSGSGLGMYLAGPKGPMEKKNAELIGGLYLVGTRGKYCAVLTERQLTIERFDGKGVRIDLAAIDRMRHLKVPMLPSGTLFLGAIAIYLGITTIVFPWNWLATFIGAGAVLANVLSRYSILAIETGSGDRHLISGDEGNLLKLCLMVDRVRHGSTIDEALFGLENLETELPSFPALRDAKGLLNAPLEFDTPNEESGEDNQTDFAFHGNVFGEGDEAAGSAYRSDIETEIPSQVPDLEHVHSDADMEDARLAGVNAYERAWGGRKSPSWYVEKDIQLDSESRMDTALSDATEGLDLFSQGGLFDVEYPTEDLDRGGSPSEFGFGQIGGNSETPERKPSSAQMIKMAHTRFGSPDHQFTSPMLPPPTEEAVRQECKAGVVREAKARQQLRLSETTDRRGKTANLEDYPALNRLASSMGANRISLRGGSHKSLSSGWITRLLRPSSGVPQSYESRKEEGFERQEKLPKFQKRLQSSQHMRLRSDQDHQAEVGSRVRQIQENNASSSAKDVLDSLVTRLSRGEEPAPRILDSPPDSLRFNQLKPTSSSEDPHPLPGLRRLG